MDHTTLTGILSFMRKAENLKNTLRSAHTSNGRCESSAEHSWRLCLFVLVIGKFFEGINTDKLLKLAVVHDLGEAISGDIPAIHQSATPGKSDMERQGMRELCSDLPPDLKTELLALWDEYEDASTPEAQIIKGLDKLETIIQHNQGKNPPDFDYEFNLAYGQEYMGFHSLLTQVREILDKETQAKACGSESL